MSCKYSAVLLRYVHDVVGAEFVNVGVVVYAPDAKFLGCICTQRYGRLSSLFGKNRVAGANLRELFRYVQARIEELGGRFSGKFDFGDRPSSIMQIVHGVVPPDDSSLQWSQEMGGVTEDPQRTLEEMYDRFVVKYERPGERQGREDEDVWKTFKRALEAERVIGYLKPYLVRARDYEHEFSRAWRNGRLNVLEPMSFDMADGGQILEKATRWLGRLQALTDSEERFKFYALVGEPTDRRLYPHFVKAKNLLDKISVEHSLVKEEEAPALARLVKEELKPNPMS